MGTSEKFCLRWNDFESNISVAFREIRDEKDFFDVTLACGDRQIQAHKLILSACSPFFRGVLRRNPHQHPLLYLKGVDYSDLQAVLNFMYHGEVNVAQEELNSFLAVAEDLKVKGLTQNNQSNSASDTNSVPKSKPDSLSQSTPRPRPGRDPSEADPGPAPKRPRPSPVPMVSAPSTVPPAQSFQTPDDDDDIQEVLPAVKSEPPSTMTVEPPPPPTSHPPGYGPGALVQNMEDSYGDDGYDYSGYDEGESGEYDGSMMDASGDGNKVIIQETWSTAGGDGQNREETVGEDVGLHYFTDIGELDDFINEHIVQRSIGWMCTLCGRTAINRLDIKRHIESKHCTTPGFSCDVMGCSQHMKTRHSLATHKRLKHSILMDGNLKKPKSPIKIEEISSDI